MTQTTILEKLKIIFEVSASSKLFIAVIAFIILLAIVALTTNRKNAKRGKCVYALVYTVIVAAILIFYHDSLGKMFDYMMNNFFIVLYFPNVAVYLAAIIITNIILLVSIFNFKTGKVVKNINIIIYTVIHYLLALVLSVITKNNLDIFSKTSVYNDKNAQAIIELSSTIFIIWIIFLIFYKLIRKHQLKDVVSVKRKVVIKKVRQLPDSIIESPVPEYVLAQPKKKEEPKLLTEEPVIIAQLTDEHLIEKQELEQKLEDAKEQLRLAEEQNFAMKLIENQLRLAQQQLKLQEEKLKEKEEHSQSLEQAQHKLEAEQIKLEYEQTRLEQEKAKLQQENKRLQASQIKPAKQENVDATVAIMQSLDSMLTLEDYKVLATILKDKQKHKNEQKNKAEQLNFAQLHEVHKSVR